MFVPYQKRLDRYIEGLGGRRERLALHACCAPCSSYCIEYLAAYFDIMLIFYNPNIGTGEEYKKRADELLRLVRCMERDSMIPEGAVACHICEYSPGDFYAAVKGLENEPERGGRCRVCYRLRLEKAAEFAGREGYDCFTTTLSISPLKNADWINELGQEAALKYNVMHLPSDFKKKGGFKRSIELSEAYGLYRQNYCGCEFSKR
jgi:hypothetical protein